MPFAVGMFFPILAISVRPQCNATVDMSTIADARYPCLSAMLGLDSWLSISCSFTVACNQTSMNTAVEVNTKLHVL